MLRLGSIGRETLVVVSVGGLMAAAALLPRVVGEPSGQRFGLPPLPAARSASVTAPIFAPPSPTVTKARQQGVLSLVRSAASVSVASSRSARPVRPPVVHTERAPAAPLPVAARRAQPVAQRRSPSSIPVEVVVAPPQPASPQVVVPPPTTPPPVAVVPEPTPAPQPAITLTPTYASAVVVVAPLRTTASSRQPATEAIAIAAPAPTKHDSSKDSAKGQDKKGHESPAAPVAAPSPVPAAPSPEQALPTTVESAPSSPSVATDPPPGVPPVHGKGPKHDPTVQPTDPGAPAPPAPGPPAAVAVAPQPVDPTQQSAPSSDPASLDTSSHGHDGDPSGSQGHGKQKGH